MIEDGYFSEVRRNWRVLLAVTLGISAGVGVAIYPQSILAPYMLKEFGWTKAQFAMLGMTPLLAVIIFPGVGRLIDVIGTRRVILVGIMLYPLSWASYSLLDGSMVAYVLLGVVQLSTGALVTSIVYTKIVVQIFTETRGLALSIMMSGPAITGALLAPQLTQYVEVYGWRSGYIVVSVFLAGLGLAGYLLLPRDAVRAPSALTRGKRDWSDYRRAFASPAFWIIFGGLALCNIPNILHTSQMALMLLDRGLEAREVALAISTFAGGVILGRFVCGLALDHFPAEYIAVVAMSLPAIGLLLLALGLPFTAVAIGSMLLVGLSQGAEGDIGAYLTVKYFDTEVYGTVYGLVVSNAVISTALGAMILSATLSLTQTYSVFLYIGTFSILAGSATLLLLRTLPLQSGEAGASDDPAVLPQGEGV